MSPLATYSNALVVGSLLLIIVWLLWLSLRVRAVGKARIKVLKALKEQPDAAEVISRLIGEVEALQVRHEELAGKQVKQRKTLGLAIRRVGVVRYDAFNDMGGQLSFSAALLNEHGDGLVLTAISGRTESRVYAKPVMAEKSTYPLSREEEQAINIAGKQAEPVNYEG